MAAKKKRPATKQPTSRGFLTGGPPMPDEFRPHGMRVLIECPEFRLVEIWRHSGTIRKVEWSEQVRMARLRSYGNKQQNRRNTGLNEVLAMMEALHQLADYDKHGEGSRMICDSMARALTSSLKAIKFSGDDTQVELAITNAITLCASAFSGFATMTGSKAKDRRRNTSTPTAADLINIADFLITGNTRVPSKEEIRKFAEGTGLRITGKRKIAVEWMELFMVAGLGGLPSSPL